MDENQKLFCFAQKVASRIGYIVKKLTFLMKFQRKGVALDLTWKRAMLIEMAKINDTYIDDINVE